MNEWSDSVRMALDVIIACVIIGALMACITIGKNIMRVMEVQDAAAADVQEYRISSQYADKDIYPQDVVNCVLSNRGWPYCVLKNSSGTILKVWSKTDTVTYNEVTTDLSGYTTTDYTSAAVGAAVDPNRMYHCTLQYDSTNQIVGYVFTAKS